MMLHNSIKLPFQAFVDKCKQAKFLGFTHGLFSSLNDTDTKNNKNGQVIILGAGPGDAELMTIKGLEHYIEPHPRAAQEKDRIWLKNTDHFVSKIF